MSKDKDGSETSKFMQAQKNFHEEKTNYPLDELFKSAEKMNLHDKATDSNNLSTENIPPQF